MLFTAHRGGRPWNGEIYSQEQPQPPRFDPHCALCPGNERLHGTNPPYEGVYGFTNDLPCFSPDSPDVDPGDHLYARRPARGTAEVVCYHPDHSKTMADLSVTEILSVVEHWSSRMSVFSADPVISHVLIFENKGSLVGTSNPHPHGQIYAGNMVYQHTVAELEQSSRYGKKHQRHLGLDIAQREIQEGRVICRNEHFIACVPWFARLAYEVLILPLGPASTLLDLGPEQRQALAEILSAVCIRYDNLWSMPMPYVMGIHQAPVDGNSYPYYPFHLEFHPPLRKPDTQKFLAGPEIGGGSMTNESDPDEKAAELRALSPVLYRQSSSS